MILETVIAEKSVIFSNNYRIKKDKITTQRKKNENQHTAKKNKKNHATREEQKITLQEKNKKITPQAEEPSNRTNIQEN